MLQYVPRSWWGEEVVNLAYIQRNLSRHLREAGLDIELGATMLDFRWMHVQAVTGGILGAKNDFHILDETLEERSGSDPALEPSALAIRERVRQICNVL